MRILQLGLALALVAGLMASCTSTHKASATCHDTEPFGCAKDHLDGPDDPCRLIRTTEAERIAGYTLGVPGRAENLGECFNQLDLPGPSSKASGNFFYALVRGQAATSQFSRATRGLHDRIANVGDAAFWNPKNDTLYALRGDVYLWVQLASIPSNRTKAIHLAQLALTRVS